jgi:polyphosphate kinase
MLTVTTTTATESAVFLNRDLSWLAFNARVLHEALDARTPLLERVKFLAIFSSNLDEFFMKRIGRLHRLIEAGDSEARSELVRLREAVLPLLREQARAFAEEIRPELKRNGICLLEWTELTDDQRQVCEVYFRRNVFPVLTPLAVDPGHPFPLMSNLSTSLGVSLASPNCEERLFARVKVPEVFPRWIPLPEERDGKAGAHTYVRLLDIIRNNLDDLFPGMIVSEVMPFRITRNADVEMDEEDSADNLIELVEEELRQRRFERVVRLEYASPASPAQLQLLMRKLELTEADVYEVSGELDYTTLFAIAGINRPELRDKPWSPVTPVGLDDDADIFAVIRTGDLLVHHPYESFDASVARFIRAAAEDPRVLALKMTVYRVGSDTPFLDALIRAAESGKQVACLVEVTARFDERQNLAMAQALEKAGVHVVYGVVGLKTHCKTALVVRQEEDGPRCYAHIGTGNYHVKTARLYTDLGLFTCDPVLTGDVVDLFHYLTGRSRKEDYRKLLVAPVNMRQRFLTMIVREAEHARAGRPAQIIAKLNQLEDRAVCSALVEASQSGVKIDLIVRGFCILAPGVPGETETIRISSVIGRFLEHSRIYYFRNGSAEPLGGEFFIGSADWMRRNLSERVEAVTPIETPAHRTRVWEILQILLSDQRSAWDLHSDGAYTQRMPKVDAGLEGLGTHQALMELTRQRSE